MMVIKLHTNAVQFTDIIHASDSFIQSINQSINQPLPLCYIKFDDTMLLISRHLGQALCLNLTVNVIRYIPA
jgi:hypothetical protein